MEPFLTRRRNCSCFAGVEALSRHGVAVRAGGAVAPEAAVGTVETRRTGQFAETACPAGSTDACPAHDVTEGVRRALASLAAVAAVVASRTG